MAVDLNMDLFNAIDINPFEDEVEIVENSQEEIKDKETIIDNNIPIDGDEIFSSQEGVDGVSSQDGEDAKSIDNADSPKLYTSIAKSLFGDGILTLDEEEINKIETAEDLASAFKKQADSLLEDNQKRINDALNSGVEVDEVKQYEGVISYLNSVTEDMLKNEDEEGEKLRKNVIYQDFINKGFKPERALKEVEKSINAGTDVDDALVSLESNKEYFNQEYDDLIESNKKEKEEKLKIEKENNKAFEKKILETEEPITGVKLDKKLRDNLLKQATKFVDKDENDKPLTELQKYAKENTVDYQYKLNLLFYLTDGFKDLNKLIGKEVTKETKSKLSELEKVLKNPNLSSTGNYDFSTSKDKEAHSGIVFAKNFYNKKKILIKKLFN